MSFVSSLADTVQSLLITGIGWIDALPDGLRAMLAALLLAAGLAYFERRIPIREVQYGQSFRKAALMALLLIPLVVWLVPISRMIIFVEALPQQADTLHGITEAVYLFWLTGFVVTLTGTLTAWFRQWRRLASLPLVEDDGLTHRLAHWRNRLGMSHPTRLHVSPGDEPRFFGSGGRLPLPAGAQYWPANQQDLLIIHGLCSLKRHHHGWHRLAQLVSCVYWPVTWTQRLHANLCRDFELIAGSLADSCYQDHLGYGRTLRQLAQRLAPSRAVRTNGRSANRGPLHGMRRYGAALARLLHPTDPAWQVGSLLEMRGDGSTALWKDPYDRVVLFVGQAVFLAVVLTGVTLRERPPDLEDRYLMPFGLLWKEHFHRNLELREKAQPKK